MWRDRQTDRQTETDRQTDRDRDRQRDRETETERALLLSQSAIQFTNTIHGWRKLGLIHLFDVQDICRHLCHTMCHL